MNPLRFLLPFHSEWVPAHRQLLVFALIVAVSLLSFYVHLLHESMALGDQMRERQRMAVSTDASKAVVQRAQLGTAKPRNVADAADSRSRWSHP